jgi:hypothetical protein
MSEPLKLWEKRFRDLMLSHTEQCIINNFKWTWANLQKYLDEKNRREERTKNGNYECRDESEIEKDRKLIWVHLFSDHQLEEFKKLLYKYFRYSTGLKYWDQIIIETEESRAEFGKIIYEVAQQHGFEYDEEMDKREDVTQFLSNINGYMSILCRQTFSVLKDIPYYWLLMSKQDLSTMALLFVEQNIPRYFHGTNYLKEMILKIFLKEINSDRHDHELSQLQKDAISEAIFRDAQDQNLNFDNIFSTGNPYLVLYNTHPSLLKA